MSTAKVRFREKVSYMFSAMGYEFEAMIIASYFTLFCTDVMQLDPAKFGAIYLAVKVFDAITDILITNIADRTKTRWGKYRPWLLAGIPLSVCLMVCFLYPPFLTTEAAKLAWVFVLLSITVAVFETAYMCPFLVLNAVMSDDPDDRIQFATAKTLGENISDFTVSLFAMSIILSFGDYKDPKGWSVMGIIYAAIMLVCVLVGFSGIRERVTVTNTDKDGNNLKLLKKLSYLKGNKPMFKLLIIQAAYQICWFGTMTMFSYYSIYVLGHEDWIAILSSLGIVAQIVTSIVTPKLAKRIEKRTLIFIGAGLLILSGISLFFTYNFATALIYQIIRGCGIGIIYICNYAMWPEVVDYTAKKTGIMTPGIIYSVESFFTKISIALGTFMVTLALDLGGYASEAYEQSAVTISWIKYTMIGLFIVFALIIIIPNQRLKELMKQK